MYMNLHLMHADNAHNMPHTVHLNTHQSVTGGARLTTEHATNHASTHDSTAVAIHVTPTATHGTTDALPRITP